MGEFGSWNLKKKVIYYLLGVNLIMVLTNLMRTISSSLGDEMSINSYDACNWKVWLEYKFSFYFQSCECELDT